MAQQRPTIQGTTYLRIRLTPQIVVTLIVGLLAEMSAAVFAITVLVGSATIGPLAVSIIALLAVVTLFLTSVMSLLRDGRTENLVDDWPDIP